MAIKISQLTSKTGKAASTDLVEIAESSGGGYVSKKVAVADLIEVVLDTSPQLGGNLDVNGFNIISTGNASIVIAPDGTGDVHLNADSVRIGDNNADATIVTRGTGDLILRTHEGDASQGSIRIYDGANGNIELLPNGSGSVLVGGNSTQATELRFREDSDNGTNYVGLKAADNLAASTTYTLPTADGTSGQVLQTNGSGTLSWSTATGGVPTSRLISTTAPLSGGGDLSADRTLSISDAAADGSTKGAATFTANDFNSASGVISLDYANGQKASGSQDGFLSSSNWTTFNNKVSTGAITSSGLTMATSRLLGRTTASSGAVEEISVGSGLTLSGGTLSASGGGGGLTNFTEAQNTSAPNTTTPVDSLTAVASGSNADFAIIPKGNGAILADIPDNTTTGGNKRGTGAVDLQMSRDVNTKVASGNNSVISGGSNNTASAVDSSVGGGINNLASGTQSRIGGGIGNTASSEFSTVGGGTSNSASASRTTVGGGSSCTATAYAASTLGGFGNTSTNNYASNLGGQSNTASGQYATVLGGGNNTASGSYSIAGGSSSVANATVSIALGGNATVNGVQGRNSYCYAHTSNGDAQSSTFIMRMRTTDATLTNLTSDGTVAATNNQVILSNQSAFRFKGTIVAKQSNSVNSAAWDIDGFIVRGANAAATTLNVSNVTVVQNTPAWGTPALSADTTAGGLRVQIQGAASTNIQWVADIKTTEVIYA